MLIEDLQVQAILKKRKTEGKIIGENYESEMAFIRFLILTIVCDLHR